MKLIPILVLFTFSNLFLVVSIKVYYECGKQAIRSGRVVGGKDTYPGEFPWMVSIRMGGKHYCGGSLINSKWILTAAHCVIGYSPSNFKVRLGVYHVDNIESTSLEVPVASIVIHESYSIPRPFSNDIALLNFGKQISFTDHIIPICLPDSNKSDKDYLNYNFKATVAGWGWTEDVSKLESRGETSNVLQKVELPLINNDECTIWYRSKGKSVIVSSKQFCAGFEKGGKDACRGDSGGPIWVKNPTNNVYMAVGIVSAGIGCALPKLPGLYTKISSYTQWIKNYTQV